MDTIIPTDIIAQNKERDKSLKTILAGNTSFFGYAIVYLKQSNTILLANKNTRRIMKFAWIDIDCS